MRTFPALYALKTQCPFADGQSTDQRHNASGAGQYPFSYESHHVVNALYTAAHEPVISTDMAIDHSCCIPWDWPLL